MGLLDLLWSIGVGMQSPRPSFFWGLAFSRTWQVPHVSWKHKLLSGSPRGLTGNGSAQWWWDQQGGKNWGLTALGA